MNVDLKKESESEKLDIKILRSPLLFVTELFLLVGAAMSVLSAGRMFDANHRFVVAADLELKQITDQSAIIMWVAFIFVAKILIAVFTTGLAAGLGIILVPVYLEGEDGLNLSGFSFIGKVNQMLVWVWCVLSAGALAVFIYRFVKYLILLVQNVQEFVFPLIAMTTGEIVMLLAAAVVIAMCIKFSKDMSDLSYQSYYMLCTRKAESHIEPSCYGMLFAVSAVFAYLVYFFRYDLVSVICFTVLSASFLLFGICIKLFGRKIEWIRYNNYKAKKAKK